MSIGGSHGMSMFKQGQTVRVIDGDHPCKGKTGTVVHINDDGSARIKVGQQVHDNVWPEECRPL